jgi:hypothetical protein
MFSNKTIVNGTAVVALALGFTGCAQSLGHFTVASTHNVRGLDYSVSDKTKQTVKGDACAKYFLGFSINQKDDLLQRAVDNAIADGHSKGLDGDLLVNVRMKQDSTSLIIYNSYCVEASGDLVKITK